MTTTLQVFAQNLRKFRSAAGLTQEQLAGKSGLSSQTVSNYEVGTRWPQADILDVLAKTLGVAPWQLLAPPDAAAADLPPDLVDAIATAARICGIKG